MIFLIAVLAEELRVGFYRPDRHKTLWVGSGPPMRCEWPAGCWTLIFSNSPVSGNRDNRPWESSTEGVRPALISANLLTITRSRPA